MKTKKKYGLFKVLLVILLIAVVASYFIKGRDSNISYIALGDIFINYVQSFYYFFDTAVFILAVGGLYGALNKVASYKKLVKDIANKIGDNKKIFVIVSTVLFALLSSLTGLNMLLLIFVPFVVSIILLLGYDKLVALSSTVVAIVAGFIGGIFITFKDASNQYATSYTTFDKMVGLKSNWGCVFPKILLLVVAVGLLVFYIVRHIKKIESGEIKDNLSHNDVFMVEAKSRNGKVVKSDDKVKTWPLIIMGILLLVILILGFMPWNSLFGLKNFTQFHKWLTTDAKIGNYVIFTSLISSNFTALGEWGSLGNYMMALVMIALFIFILKFISKVKFSELMDGFVYGVKKMIPSVMIAMLAYTLLICVYSNGFLETIITNASKTFGDNVIVGSFISMIGSIVHVDTYYTVSGVFTPIVSSLSDKANLSVYAVMFQSMYGLVQVFGPTSLLLIVGLSYLDVPYSKWLKYIWRFVLELFIAIIVIVMLVSVL